MNDGALQLICKGGLFCEAKIKQVVSEYLCMPGCDSQCAFEGEKSLWTALRRQFLGRKQQRLELGCPQVELLAVSPSAATAGTVQFSSLAMWWQEGPTVMFVFSAVNGERWHVSH